MTTALGYLFLLLPVAAVVWIVWTYKRKAGDKEARRREREAALVGLVHTTGTTARPAPVERAAAAPGVAAPAASGGAVAAPRDRFLSPPETLVYYLLRSGIPGYEVFPRVGLASVLAGARATPAAAGANAHDLDFVVCDKSMRIVAAIQLKGRLMEPEATRVARSLAAAGVRLVTIDPRALPKREELGTLILARAV